MGCAGSHGAKRYKAGVHDELQQGKEGLTAEEQEASATEVHADASAAEAAEPVDHAVAAHATWRSTSGKHHEPCSPPRHIRSEAATASNLVSGRGETCQSESCLRTSAAVSSKELPPQMELNSTENATCCPPRVESAVMDEWRRACRRAHVPPTPLGQLQEPHHVMPDRENIGSPVSEVTINPNTVEDSPKMAPAVSAMELDVGRKPTEEANSQLGNKEEGSDRPAPLLTPESPVAGFWRWQEALEEEVDQELSETRETLELTSAKSTQVQDLHYLDPGLPSPQFQQQVAELLKERERVGGTQQKAGHDHPGSASNGAANSHVASKPESASGFDLLPGCMVTEGSPSSECPWVDLVTSRRPVPLSALPLLVNAGEDPLLSPQPAPAAALDSEGLAAMSIGIQESLQPSGSLNMPRAMSLRSPSSALDGLNVGSSKELTPNAAEVALAFPWRQGTRSLLSSYTIQSLKQQDAQADLRLPGRSSTAPPMNRSPCALPPCPGPVLRIESGPSLFPSDRALKACGSQPRGGISLPPLGGHDHKMRKVATEDAKKKVHFGDRGQVPENWAHHREVESTGHRRRGWKNPFVKDRRDER